MRRPHSIRSAFVLLTLTAVVVIAQSAAMASDAAIATALDQTPDNFVSSTQWDAKGGYAIVAGLNAFETFKNTGQDFENSWGFAVRGGYRLNRFLALEGSFEFLSGFDVDVLLQEPPPLPPSQPNPAPLTVDGGNGTANVKAYLPWFGRIQPYGLFGLGGAWYRLRTDYATGTVCSPGFVYWYCSDTYTKLGNSGAFLMKFGGGTEIWLSESFGLVVDAAFNLPTGDLKNLRYTSLTWGGIFRF